MNALARASSQSRRFKATACRNRCDKKANDVTEAPKNAHAVIVHTKSPHRKKHRRRAYVDFPRRSSPSSGHGATRSELLVIPDFHVYYVLHDILEFYKG